MTPDDWLRIYRQTEYRFAGLDGQGPVGLYVDQAQPALQTVYDVFKVQCAAYITACNPLSRALDDAENQLRQARLKADLSRRGFSFLMGEGRPLRPGWKPEPSLLVPGMRLPDAIATGHEWQQNAIVWAGPDCIPRLHWVGQSNGRADTAG